MTSLPSWAWAVGVSGTACIAAGAALSDSYWPGVAGNVGVALHADRDRLHHPGPAELKVEVDPSA